MELEALKVKIQADSKAFQAGMGAAERTSKNFHKQMSELTRGLNVSNRALRAVAQAEKAQAQAADAAAKATKQLGDEHKKLSDKVGSAGQDLRKFNSTINSIISIVGRATGVIRDMYDAASEGAKIQGAETFFKNSGKSIEEYRQAVNGMVSDAELMKKANLADSMGIDEETFKQLARVAEAASLKTGQSFDYMFNSIITGTARSSRLLLDNLGIIVSVKVANQRYAEQLGKNVEALSAEEKQTAFVMEVRRQSQGQLEEFANAGKLAAFEFAQFEAALSNVGDAIKKLLADLVSGTGLLGKFAKAFQNIADALGQSDWKTAGLLAGSGFLLGFLTLANELTSILPRMISKALGFVAEQINSVFGTNFATKLNLNVMGDSIVEGIEKYMEGLELKVQVGKQAGKNADQSNYVGAMGKLAEAVTPGAVLADVEEILITTFAHMPTDEFKQLSPEVQTLAKNAMAAAKALGFIPEAPKSGGGGAAPGGSGGSAPKGSPKWSIGDTVMDFGDALEDVLHGAMDEAAAAKARFEEMAAAGTASSDEYFDGLQAKWAEAERSAEDAVGATDDLINAIKAEMEALSNTGGQVMAGALNGNLFETIGTIAKPAVATAATALAAPLGPAAPFVGGAVAELAPFIGSLIDSLEPVVALLQGLADGLSLLVNLGLAEFLRPLALLADPVMRLIGAFGVLIEAVLAPFMEIFTIVVAVVGAVVDIIGALFLVMSPIVELMLTALVWPLTLLGPIIHWVVMGLKWFAEGLYGFVRMINNAIVGLIRMIPGMHDFGNIMDENMFDVAEDEDEDPATEENTEAVKENTQAVRDLQREFRNLPSGYKVNNTIYTAQDPDRTSRRRANLEGAVRRGPRGSFYNQRARV